MPELLGVHNKRWTVSGAKGVQHKRRTCSPVDVDRHDAHDGHVGNVDMHSVADAHDGHDALRW